MIAVIPHLSSDWLYSGNLPFGSDSFPICRSWDYDCSPHDNLDGKTLSCLSNDYHDNGKLSSDCRFLRFAVCRGRYGEYGQKFIYSVCGRSTWSRLICHLRVLFSKTYLKQNKKDFTRQLILRVPFLHFRACTHPFFVSLRSSPESHPLFIVLPPFCIPISSPFVVFFSYDDRRRFKITSMFRSVSYSL